MTPDSVLPTTRHVGYCVLVGGKLIRHAHTGSHLWSTHKEAQEEADAWAEEGYHAEVRRLLMAEVA